jgi:cysteine-S-conjugate beta-lyase
MVYDFDTVIDRTKSSSVKWSFRKERTGIPDVIPMWIADMDYACAPEIVDALRKRVEFPIYGYTDRTDGYYKGLINWMKKRHGWHEVKQEWIIFTPGVVAGFNFAVQAYSHPGDKIIVQPPCYYPFFDAIINNGRRIVENPLKIVDGNYVMDYDDLEKKIDGRTKMIILCSPHNPVGRVWKKSELEALVDVCERKDIIILSDEIHNDLILGETKHTPTINISEEAMQRTATLVAPSKTFNLAGLITSSAVIPNKKLRDTYANVTENNRTKNTNIFGIVAQEAAYAKGEPWLEELLIYLRGNFQYLDDFVKKRIPKLKVYPLEGTYLAWVDCSNLGMNDKSLNEFMLKKAKLWLDEGILFGYGGSMFMRFNIACPRSVLMEALKRLEIAVNQI